MIKNILHLVRWPNLLVVAATMTAMLAFVIHPLLGRTIFAAGLSLWAFLMLVASVVLITTGGYIINDIADINPDSVNKPGKNVVGEGISTQIATRLYWITTIMGLALGTLFSYQLQQINYSLIFGLVWLFSFFALSNQAEVFASVQLSFPFITRVVLIYAAFAFLVTLFREVVKDLEDYGGDYRFGCRTLPVAFGTIVARVVALITGYITIAGMIWVTWSFYRSGYVVLAIWFVLMALMMFWMLVKLHRSEEKQNYSRLSTLSKVLMLMGVFSMVFFYFES